LAPIIGRPIIGQCVIGASLIQMAKDIVKLLYRSGSPIVLVS